MISQKEKPLKGTFTWLLIYLIAFQPLFTSFAHAQTQAEPDASRGKNPHITNAANGPVVVEIRTPSGSGLSHNQYLNLQVGRDGIIFNNSGQAANTQLAGYIAGNKYIGGPPASRILSEITGNLPTNINGYMEIAGQRADLIIANPNGITGNNFGFINTNRGVLTTGVAQIQNGELSGFSVTGGQIAIEGQGLDATGATKTEILANAVKINAALHANDLNIVTGSNETKYSTDAARALETGDRGGVSLDVSELGGMYAGRITLVGTRKGLGVNNEGIVSAQNITISQEGKIQNTGLLNADKTITVKTKSDLDNAGRVYGDNIAIEATALNNSSGSANAPVIAGRENLNIEAAVINNKEHALILSEGGLSITGGTINNNSATIEAKNKLAITAQDINNTNEHFSIELEITASEDIVE
jgi:filamentous hemagglutinin